MLKIEVKGLELEVDALAAADRAREKAEEKVARIRTSLDASAAKKRRELEARGTFTKTLVFLGTKLNACYTFKDSYRDVDVGQETLLRQLVGPFFDMLFHRKKEMQVRQGKMDELRSLLGERADDFLETREWVEAIKDLAQVRFNVLSKMTNDQKAALDGLLGQISSKPSLSLK